MTTSQHENLTVTGTLPRSVNPVALEIVSRAGQFADGEQLADDVLRAAASLGIDEDEEPELIQEAMRLYWQQRERELFGPRRT